MSRRNNHILLFVLVMALLFLGYLRNSYYIHLNLEGHPFFQRMTRTGAMYLEDGGVVRAREGAKLLSVIQYGCLFLIVHTIVLWVAFKDKGVLTMHLVAYFGLSLLSLIMFLVYNRFPAIEGLYFYASFVKNFLLSPLYTGVAYIFVKYLPKLVH